MRTKFDDVEITPPAVIKDDPTSDNEDFIPTRAQRKCKSLLISKLLQTPEALSVLTLDDAIKLTGIKPLRDWWKNELFVGWLTNSSSQAARAHYLLSRHLDNLEEIIEGDEFDTRLKLAAGKQVQDMIVQARDEGKRRALTEEEIERLAEKRIEKEEATAIRGPVVTVEEE